MVLKCVCSQPLCMKKDIENMLKLESFYIPTVPEHVKCYHELSCEVYNANSFFHLIGRPKQPQN